MITLELGNTSSLDISPGTHGGEIVTKIIIRFDGDDRVEIFLDREDSFALVRAVLSTVAEFQNDSV